MAGDVTFTGFPATTANAFVMQDKNDTNNNETLALGTWTKINTLTASFNLNLPQLSSLNDGREIVLEIGLALTPVNRLTLTPNGADFLDHGLLELAASPGSPAAYEANHHRIVRLTADFTHSVGPRWRIVETPDVTTPVKELVDFAAFDPLPFGVPTPAGSLVGKTLTAGGNGILMVDGQAPSISNSILVGGQADPIQNGLYNVTVVGTGGTQFVLTRRTDAHLSAYAVMRSLEVRIVAGGEWAGTRWRTKPALAVIDTDAWNWDPVRDRQRIVLADTIAANQNDYGSAVTGWRTTGLIKIDGGGANRTITGLDALLGALAYRDEVTVMNVGLFNTLILSDNDNGVNSDVANEMRFPLGLDHVLGAGGDAIGMFYDTDHWRPL